MPLNPYHISTLHILCNRLDGTGITWAITGSIGMALQGVDLTPHDIDLQSDGASIQALAEKLSDYMVEPLHWKTGRGTRSYFAVCNVEGMQVELMAGLEKRGADGKWSPAPPLSEITRWVEFDDMRLPVLDLHYECEAYRAMGRFDKVKLMEDFLSTHPAY